MGADLTSVEPYDPDLDAAWQDHEATRVALEAAAKVTLRTHVKRAAAAVTHVHFDVGHDDGNEYLAEVVLLTGALELPDVWDEMESSADAAAEHARERGSAYPSTLDHQVVALPSEERAKVVAVVAGQYPTPPFWTGLERLWHLAGQPSGLHEL